MYFQSPWADVRKEMIEEKGLNDAAADLIGTYVQLSGGTDLVDKLLQDDRLKSVKSAVKGLEEMKLLLQYCKVLGVEKNVLFDLSLARGLDYYTGVIYECVLKSDAPVDSSGEQGTIGSVAGGGRYDNLVGMFDPKKKQVPCVGVSIGVERIFSLLEARQNAQRVKVRTTEIEVYVASAHKGLHEKRLKIISSLWDKGIKVSSLESCSFAFAKNDANELQMHNTFILNKFIHSQAEHSYKTNPKLLAQLQHCEENGIPLAIVLGDSELERGVVKLREVTTRKEDEVKLEDLADEIIRRLRS